MKVPLAIFPQAKMAAPLPESKKEAEVNKASQEKPRSQQEKNDSSLLGAVQNYNYPLFEKAIAYKANINALHVRSITGVTSDAPAVTLAICKYNRKALVRLLELGARIDIPDDRGSLPIQYGVSMGDFNMVQALMRFKAKLNYLAGYGTALHCLLSNVTGYSLVQNADWQAGRGAGFEDQLADWFEEIKPKPKLDSLSATYTGNLKLINFILETHPELLSIANRAQLTPLKIAQNPKLYLDQFTDEKGKPIKCVAAPEEGVLILSDFLIYNRSMKDSFLVKELRFDFSEIRKAFEAVIKPNESIVIKKMEQLEIEVKIKAEVADENLSKATAALQQRFENEKQQRQEKDNKALEEVISLPQSGRLAGWEQSQRLPLTRFYQDSKATALSITSAIKLFLILDVCLNLLFFETNCRYCITPGPKSLSFKIPFLS